MTVERKTCFPFKAFAVWLSCREAPQPNAIELVGHLGNVVQHFESVFEVVLVRLFAHRFSTFDFTSSGNNNSSKPLLSKSSKPWKDSPSNHLVYLFDISFMETISIL